MVVAGIVLCRCCLFTDLCGTKDLPVVEVPRDTTLRALTESMCREAGGTWEGCGSACRGQETDVCIDVCVEYCLCKAHKACPTGFQCSDVIQGEGICK